LSDAEVIGKKPGNLSNSCACFVVHEELKNRTSREKKDVSGACPNGSVEMLMEKPRERYSTK
jgi:hypothetical protein